MDAATPRTAAETMWVMGEVNLMESRLARLIINPTIPVTRAPQIKVRNGDMVLGTLRKPSLPRGRFVTLVPSKMTTRLVYQESKVLLPFTIMRLFLITTECIAATEELAMPKETPGREMGVPLRKMPHKKTRGDCSAGDEDAQRRLGVQDDARDADGECKDWPTSPLVE
jgi:hypothetical protein